MTEAYAIKDSTGKIIDVGMDEADLKRQWHSSYTCVPVTVSEKGEAEAFPEVPLPDKTVYGPNRTVVGHFYTYARVKQFRDACLAYLSRGQG